LKASSNDGSGCRGGAKAVLQAIVAARASTAVRVDRQPLISEVEEMNGSGPRMTTRIDRDGPLVAALRRGDPTAAEDLVAAYGDRACRLAKRITGNAQDAEEPVQDAFLSVIGRIDTFRGDATFGSWLYRIVANAAYQCCRRRRGRGADVSLDKLLPVLDEHGRHVAPVADWSRSVDDPARQTELRMVLSTAIEELPADYRAIVLLRDVEGLAPRDIAAIFDLAVGNVKTRVHRARLFLRKQLEAHLSPQRSSVSGRSVPRRTAEIANTASPRASS
jgi:RNA polymerase sigma-70 factor, ECF subfamily